jgi:hypothetical protein
LACHGSRYQKDFGKEGGRFHISFGIMSIDEAQKNYAAVARNGFIPPEAHWATATVPRIENIEIAGICGFLVRTWGAAWYNTRRGRFPSTRGG